MTQTWVGIGLLVFFVGIPLTVLSFYGAAFLWTLIKWGSGKR